jgi:hypothetical protein
MATWFLYGKTKHSNLKGLTHMIIELRAIKPKDVRVSHYDTEKQPGVFMKRALELSDEGYDVYFTINPLKLSMLPGEEGLVEEAAKDEDVESIIWLPYDIDPTRGVEGRVASTDAEKAEALKVAEAIMSFWEAWDIEPALWDSGNGYYILVPCDVDPARRR